MLKHIPFSFTPELLKLIMAMGHGEELLIADANYPALSTGGPDVSRLYLPILHITEFLADILYYFPLDETVKYPAVIMEGAKTNGTFELYSGVFSNAGVTAELETVERFAFYERAAEAAGIIITSDTIRAGNILLKKGVVR